MTIVVDAPNALKWVLKERRERHRRRAAEKDLAAPSPRLLDAANAR